MKKLIDSVGVDNLVSIIGFCVTIIVVFLTSYLTTKSNQKKMVSESFKREGIKIQERLLEFWSGILCYDIEQCYSYYKKNAKLSNNITNLEIIKLLHKDGIMYSSSSTIKAIGTYQQYSYKIAHRENKDYDDSSNIFGVMESLIVPLRVLKRMKYDFTGEKVSELDLLRVKLNDWDFSKALVSYLIIIYYYFKERFFVFILVVLILSFLIINILL